MSGVCTDWRQVPITHSSFTSDASYFQTVQALNKDKDIPGMRFDLLQQAIDEADLTKGSSVSMTRREVKGNSHSEATVPIEFKLAASRPSYPPSPQKLYPSTSVNLGGMRQRRVIEPKIPVTITESSQSKRHWTIKSFEKGLWGLQQALKFVSWTYRGGLWLLKGGWGYLYQFGSFIKQKYLDRKPQVLKLPATISETNPGWDVQARQLAYETLQLKDCFAQMGKDEPLQFPLKLAIEIIFSDKDESQTVQSQLLITNQEAWKQVDSFADELYRRVVFERKKSTVSVEFTMDVTFAAVCLSPDGQDKCSIYQRATQYRNGTRSEELAKGFSQLTCDKEGVAKVIESIPGIKQTSAWVKDVSTWESTGKVLATYLDGKNDPKKLIGS